MDTIILGFQVLCVAVLAFGTVLSMFQLIQGDSAATKRFSYAASNDFETNFRRLARNGN